ncbi:Pyruvate carboxylase [Plasmodiophora brassicae]
MKVPGPTGPRLPPDAYTPKWFAVGPGEMPLDGSDSGAETTYELSRAVARSIAPAAVTRSITKIMAANRGEIAMRICRAAHELGLNTVAIFSTEDRLSLHRYRADESYLVGEGKAPIAAYLDMDDILRIAIDNKVDAIHPGYGFLSESSEFAERVRKAGIIFVGPSADAIERLGTKTKARTIAIAAGVPVIPGSDGPCQTAQEVHKFTEQHGLPIILKAAYGGGGRGMRVVRSKPEIDEAFRRASSEALASFGNGTVFVERFLSEPRHIEVQIMGDTQGNVVHFFERDCSVQRRYQKVVEFAPAQNLAPTTRTAILADALKIAKEVGYYNAGTVEFLVDEKDRHYFIEVNPRIQVEHTVSEEITGFDLVKTQIAVACGVPLSELGITQDAIHCHGCAIQLRITTEDPVEGFRPDSGRLEVYRSSGGIGVRQDGACAAGSIVSPHYDSLLVKVIVSALTFDEAIIRCLRALAEFRIRGVKTNIPFLQKLLTHPYFRQHRGAHTNFIDQTPDVLTYRLSADRATRLLSFLSDIKVNGLDLPNKVDVLPDPAPLPPLDLFTPTPDKRPSGFRDILLRHGPKAFAKAVREHEGLLIMDTTWRDAHQSLLATRVRTYDIKQIAKQTSFALAKAYSIECWGGATFDVALRFLHECPWERLETLRRRVPNIPFQMLLRGANAVGYTSYPDNVVFEFVKCAQQHGIDIFRVFDSLNSMENLALGIKAIHAAGAVVEACICYTGDVSDSTKTKYTTEYYLDLVRQLVELDIHVLAIKDMAGLLKPKAARILVGAIRKEFPWLPIHVHTHDTAGTGVAAMIACGEAGADVVDAAIDSLSGLTSQPSMGAIVGALEGTPLDTGLSLQDLSHLNDYWEMTRELYAAFESPSLRSGNSDVYIHEMPGGQYTNLQYQAFKLGLGKSWPAIKVAYAQANRLLGDIVKVTPSSKVVGDLAQFMVQNGLSEDDVRAQAKTLSFPTSVVQFFQGYIGIPQGGFPEPLRSDVVRDLPCFKERPGKTLPPLDFADLRDRLEKKFSFPIRECDILSAALYPQVFDEYGEFVTKYGDISVLPTPLVFAPVAVGKEVSFEIERGKRLYVKLLTVGPATGSGKREVFWEVNGNARSVHVDDRTAAVDSKARPASDPNDPGSVGAPMSGVVVDVRVTVGTAVKVGDPLAVLSAMKMETVVAAPVGGVVAAVAVSSGDSITAGDLIASIKKAPE